MNKIKNTSPMAMRIKADIVDAEKFRNSILKYCPDCCSHVDDLGRCLCADKPKILTSLGRQEDIAALHTRLARLVKAAKELIDIWDSESDVPLVINDTIDNLKSALKEASG